MHERFREKLLSAWGRTVASRPILTLTVCLVLAAASVYLTATRLEFHADRSKLIDPDKSWNRQYASYKENFPHDHDVIVVIDGEPGDSAIDQLARTIADRLEEDDRIDSADAGFEVGDAGPRFFRYASPDQFDRALDELEQARQLVVAENANAALGMLLAGLNDNQDDPGALDRLEQFLAPYQTALGGEPASFDFLLPDASRWQPLRNKDGLGRLRYVRVHLNGGSNGLNRIAATLSWLRQRIGEIIGESPVLYADWGITGIPAIESDETTQAIRDSTTASLLAIALITLVMFLAFRGLAVPLLAALSLLIGMAWSFGWLILSVGHLQLLSVVFSVILLGLGIDFALLFVSRLELVQGEHPDLPSATARVYRRMGPGMVTGAVTTAAAFAATALTDFKGMAEMGTIAAGGIVLCLIAVLSAFPALLALTGKWKSIIRHRPGGEEAHFANGRLDFVDARPVATLATAGIVAVVLIALAFRVGYDPNIMHLQSAGVESVKWEHRIVEEDARSVWSAVVLAEPQETPDAVDRLREAEGVSGIGGMGMLFPPDLDEREQRIAELRDRPREPRTASAGLGTVLTQLATVRVGLSLRSGDASAQVRGRLEAIGDGLARSMSAPQQMTPQEQQQAWAALDAAFVEARDTLGSWLDRALSPGPPSADDLPPFLEAMWIGRNGMWLLQVHPSADPDQRSILAPERLGPFVDSVKSALSGTGIDVIGAPVQIYESSLIIQKEYAKAAIFAVIAILALLMLDFRRPLDALCAMAPVTVGFIGAFGIMGLIGVPLNFANIIILPIIFGIGVNAGVQMIHRWRQEPNGLPKGLSGGTGRGITLTMVTTMIGFGCLLLAEHRGIRSLGFVMVIGLSVTLAACYTVLPAVLRLRGRAAEAVALPAETRPVTEGKTKPHRRRVA